MRVIRSDLSLTIDGALHAHATAWVDSGCVTISDDLDPSSMRPLVLHFRDPAYATIVAKAINSAKPFGERSCATCDYRGPPQPANPEHATCRRSAPYMNLGGEARWPAIDLSARCGDWTPRPPDRSPVTETAPSPLALDTDAFLGSPISSEAAE